MKIDIKDNEIRVAVGTLKVGKTFSAPRTSTWEKEKGFYMVVDKNSGLLSNTKCIVAINLESGQLRKFDICTMVHLENLKVISEK